MLALPYLFFPYTGPHSRAFQDKTIMPTGQETLIATVDGTLGTIAIPPPSGGFPVGSGFQVNFVKDPQDLNTILAQSGQFTITQSNSTSSTTLASNTVVYVFFFRPLGAYDRT